MNTPDASAGASELSPTSTAKREDYSVEVVAAVAVHLLANHNHAGAAKEAIKLLDACRGELATRAKHAGIFSRARTERKAWWDKYVPTKEGKTYLMPWTAALLHITNKDDTTKAQPRFKKFYTFFWQDSDATAKSIPFEQATPPTSKEIEDRIAKFKREGMDSHRAGMLKAAYEGWSRFDAVAQAREKARKRHAPKGKVD